MNTRGCRPESTHTPDSLGVVDVAIIGGGIIGLSIARTCAARGQSVAVFEAGSSLGGEASWAAAGMLAPYAEVEFNEDEMLSLCEQSLRQWPQFAEDLERESGVNVGYDDSGSLVLALDRDEKEHLQRLYQYQQKKNLRVQWLGTDELLELEPALSPRIVGGILVSEDHQVDQRAAVIGLTQLAEKSGVKFCLNCRVRAVEPGEKAEHKVLLESGKGVSARTVVLAAGAWSRMIRGLAESSPEVRPVKGQAISLRATDSSIKLPRHVLRARWRGLGGYLVPKHDRLVIGATSEERGFDTVVRAGGIFELLRMATEVLPLVHELEFVETWANFRPTNRENAPLIGATKIPRLQVATGHYRHGILLTPLTTRVVADGISADLKVFYER